MAIYADRVRETTTTTGTGTYSLGGAATGFRTFVAGVASTSVVVYTAEDGTNWEVGEGTVTSGSPDTLSRTTILSSSNAGAAVSWAAGTKNIFLDAAAARIATTDRAITFTSTVAAVSFNATSTKRVKKKVKNLSKDTLAKFTLLKPREYDRKDYEAHEFGFIAEEMELVYPEVVGKDAEGKPSGIDYGKLSTILTAKVLEQQGVIEKLQSDVASLLQRK
jgi:hypothetical protein